MKTAAYPLLLLALAACNRPAMTPATETATSIVGTWRLAALQTQLPGGKLPNETFTLTADQKFRFYKDDKLLSEGTYTLGTGSACGGATSTEPLLSVSPTTPTAYAPAGNYTLAGNTLVIDQCRAADGPYYMFERQR